jgi:serine/threonine protein kinase
VMPYFPGGTLDQLLPAGPMDPLEVLIRLRPLISAIAAMHNGRAVHRDIKPANIFIAPRGNWILGDFGIAFSHEEGVRLTETEERVGSRDWLPLWHELGKADAVTPATDCYALGKLLWALVTGRQRLPKVYDGSILKECSESDGGLWIESVVRSTVVATERECVATAGELLNRLGPIATALKDRSYSQPIERPRCRVCGLGSYQAVVDFDHNSQRNFGLPVVTRPRFRILACDYCRHVEFFYSESGAEGMKW